MSYVPKSINSKLAAIVCAGMLLATVPTAVYNWQISKETTLGMTRQIMSMSPSAISKAICRLENDLGRRLFQRSSRSIHLTDEGHEFLVAANRVVEALIDAQSIGSAEPTGTLRIRCLPTFAKYAIAPRIPAFMFRLADCDRCAIGRGALGNDSRWCGGPKYRHCQCSKDCTF